ncbi:hypothetical protein UFOVP1437_51 [uncultured Caudovirales phage]|uniref:Uncharacterized protein n=1 Tax=uncultured Caudovirales phage TaxID=2100421 RepID=A0A6J7XDC1_9CAUD|nr:hypothetical protein UFOVP1437_51 [uncultured Caudovirales phage]CAB5228120.1 hypothetical protein UFOVP1531_14 [uncultured Caudovirales phage]
MLWRLYQNLIVVVYGGRVYSSGYVGIGVCDNSCCRALYCVIGDMLLAIVGQLLAILFFLSKLSLIKDTP